MKSLRIVFHDEFLVFRKKRQDLEVDYPLTRIAPVKDILEALGVPHTEVGALVSNRKNLGFESRPSPDHPLFVFPVPRPFDIRKASFLRPRPFPVFRFLVDENVVKLGTFLRMLGLDTVFYPGATDSEIADIAKKTERVVLSKDIGLFKRKAIVYGRYVRAVHPVDQVREVADFFDLERPFRLFSRCLVCNMPLVPVSKSSILHRLEPKTKLYFQEFSLCPACDKIFWKGSHHEHMMDVLESIP